VISGRIAKDVFAVMFATGGEPEAIVEERGLKQVTDTSAIEALVEKLIADNPGQVATAQKNPKVAGWFTGQVMKATGGKANPGVVNGIVARKLGLS
jgi:aspartyl-tRNA(Asn)/glutamyl-tRNA(Gln) amidotransferase subunit B